MGRFAASTLTEVARLQLVEAVIDDGSGGPVTVSRALTTFVSGGAGKWLNA